MMRHPSQPDPVPGAALYWAAGSQVLMKDTEGHVSCIQACRTEEAAVNAALRWQKKENAVVTKENKRRAKAGEPLLGSPAPEYKIGYMQGRGAA